MSEFNLIDTYFTWNESSSNIIKGIGDDAAIIKIPDNKYLVTSVDTSIEGVHFPLKTPASDIAYKSLAVNLSDLAAMGAMAKWFTLALTLPTTNNQVDAQWLSDFSQGLKQLAQQSACALIGGDTTQGPLSITIQVMGLIEPGEALLRSGAKSGDFIYVTGTVGDAAAGLATILSDFKMTNKADLSYCQQRLNKPTARLTESQIIKQYASSCIDISDGLLQDLNHILKASQVGARINTHQLPLSKALRSLTKEATGKSTVLQFALSGGDDYELLFTVPQKNNHAFLKAADFKVSCIGEINEDIGMIVDENGDQLTASGYNHFNE
jgi:thiamine-monophosphate kinase